MTFLGKLHNRLLGEIDQDTQYYRFGHGVIYSSNDTSSCGRTFVDCKSGIYWLNSLRKFAQIQELILILNGNKSQLFAKCQCYSKFQMFSNFSTVSLRPKHIDVVELCLISQVCAYVETKHNKILVFFDSHYGWNTKPKISK